MGSMAVRSPSARPRKKRTTGTAVDHGHRPVTAMARRDEINVDIGISLWNRYGYALRRHHIRKAILANIPRYEEAMRNDAELRFLEPLTNAR